MPDGSFSSNGSAFSYSVWEASLAQRKDVEAVVVQHGHHAIGCRSHSHRSGTAFKDFGHVPYNGWRVLFDQRQRRKNRGVAAAPGDDHLCAGCQRVLKRFYPHHPDDMGRCVDIGLAQRCRRRQGACTAIMQVSPDNLSRQFRMDDGKLEMEVLLAGDLAHNVDHPREPRIRSRGAGRADDQRDASLDRAGHHDLGVALDCGR